MREDYDDGFWEKHSIKRPRGLEKIVDEFELLINKSPTEAEVQYFLEACPWLLSEQFPHCHAILPQFSLGGQYIADFIAPERSSGGTMWFLIEIERPNHRLITKDGEFSHAVRKAISQVRDWKMWLRENQEQARKSRRLGGLGLYDISNMIVGKVIIGRRFSLTDRFNQLRNHLLETEGIQITTYDSIIEWCRKRAQFWENWDAAWERGKIPFLPEM